mgnify:CR=1 FL=1
MAIENRDLKTGTKLIARFKKEEYRAEVVAGEEGKIRYRLADGKEFKSLSSAGTAVTTKACNGWAFWSIEPDSAPTEPEEPETSEEQGEESKIRRPRSKRLQLDSDGWPTRRESRKER